MAPAGDAGSGPGQRRSAVLQRSPAEIEEKLALRADRALRHFQTILRGKTPRTCPICGYHGPFSPVRHKPEIWCPGCDSRPRHRLLKLWMDREMAMPEGARVLHFAAEPWVRDWLEDRGARYVTADINDLFELKLDIEAIDQPDGSWDMVIANHVLEHVDDRKALAELYRVLSPSGQLVLTVPMVEGWDETYQDDSLDEAERKLRYGDPTHRCFYGRDVRDRIRAAGFRLTEYPATEPDVGNHALHRGERVFIGRKA